MKKRVYQVLLLIFWVNTGVMAQDIYELIIVPNHSRMGCPEQDAGTISGFRLLSGESMDIGSDPIYLCANDQILIEHNHDYDLTGDDDMSTPAGIGYAFYTCAPTVSGNLFSDIKGDNCLLDSPPPPNNGIWVAKDKLNGNMTILNDGHIQDTYFNGAPGRLWFAPITINDFESITIPDNSCTKVRTDQAFSIVYLNKISISNATTDSAALQGSFTVGGGLPEYDGSNYTISITNFEDPAITGNILNASAGHGEVVNFDVPEAGAYVISVTDDKGCTVEQLINVPTNDPINFCLPDLSGAPGTEICVPVTVSNFNNILSFSFSLQWDPTILQYTRFIENNPILPSISTNLDRQGEAGFFLFDLNSTDAYNLTDGDTVFLICFTIVGDVGSSSPIIFTDKPTVISVTDDNKELPFTFKNGKVNVVEGSELDFKWNACYDAAGTATVTIQVFGGIGPYQLQIIFQGTTTLHSVMVQDFTDIQTFTGLTPAAYDILIQDLSTNENNGGNDFIVIQASTGLQLTTDALDTLACQSAEDGIIRLANITGGSGFYNVVWELPDGSRRFDLDSLVDLPVGEYRLTAIDSLNPGCSVTDTVNIIANSLDFSLSTLMPDCEMDIGDGEIRATLNTVGNNSINYKLIDEDSIVLQDIITGDSHTFRTLNPGQYMVEVNDGICPPVVKSVSLIASKELFIQVDSIRHINCFGEDDGYLSLSYGTVNGFNEQPPYQYTWSNDDDLIIINDRARQVLTAADISGGTFDIAIIDDGGCSIDTTITIEEPDSFYIRATIVRPPDCPDGLFAEATFTFNEDEFGGVEPYIYTWFDGTNGPSNFFIPKDSLVTVSGVDANGCTDTIEIGPIGVGPNIAVTVEEGPKCIGDSNAVLRVFRRFGDTDGLDISWSNGVTSDEANGFSAGWQWVDVTEDGCTIRDSIFVNEPDFGVNVINPMTFSPRSSCIEPDSGWLWNFTHDYAGPYQFVWNDFDTVTQNLPFIVRESGTFRFSLQQRGGDECIIYSDTVSVTFPGKVQLDSTVTAVSCFGDTDGAFTAILNRENAGNLYNFTLVDQGVEIGSATSDRYEASNLEAGLYQLRFQSTSDSTCFDDIPILVDEPLPLRLAIDSASTGDIRCFGENNGRIGLRWIGGNQGRAPIINWTPDVNNSLLAENLSPGNYNVYLEDWKGCSDTINVNISEPEELEAFLGTVTEPECNGLQTAVTIDTALGGTGPNYSFNVDNGPNQVIGTEIPVFAGQHLITVFDAVGCPDTQLIVINEPPPLEVTLAPEIVVGLGDSIVLEPQVDGPFPIVDYSWESENGYNCSNCRNPVISPFETSIYTLSVVDAMGCTGDSEILVRVSKERKIFIPNVFTPNSDGFNDYFTIFTSAGVANIRSVKIFDRFGNLMYDRADLGSSILGVDTWDGRVEHSSSSEANPGVYVYLVEVVFIDGRELLYRGDVTLLR